MSGEPILDDRHLVWRPVDEERLALQQVKALGEVHPDRDDQQLQELAEELVEWDVVEEEGTNVY